MRNNVSKSQKITYYEICKYLNIEPKYPILNEIEEFLENKKKKNKVSISKTYDVNRSKNKLGTLDNETRFSLKGLCAVDK